MTTGPANARSRQHTFRIPVSLDDRLTCYALRHGMARNRAVVDLLTKALYGEVRQGDTPRDAAGDSSPADPVLYERIAALEAKLEALQPQAPARPKSGALNEATQYLGPLCERGHDWDGTGQSRRSKRNGRCMACEAEAKKAKRAEKRQATKDTDEIYDYSRFIP